MVDSDKQISLGASIFGLVPFGPDPELLKLINQPPATPNKNGTEHGNVCSTKGLKDKTNKPDAAISELARRGVSPDTFRIEDKKKRLDALTQCTPAQKKKFLTVESKISDSIKATKTPEEIAKKLEQLYSKAYSLDGNVNNIQAKKKLSLWIAAMEQAAYKDKKVLDAIWKDPKIRQRILSITALNSNDLLEKDRGNIHLLGLASALGKPLLQEVYEAQSINWLERSFTWLNGYKGKAYMYGDKYWRNFNAYNTAAETVLGKVTINEVEKETFPHRVVKEEEEIEKYSKDRSYIKSWYQNAKKKASNKALLKYRHQSLERHNKILGRLKSISNDMIKADLMLKDPKLKKTTKALLEKAKALMEKQRATLKKANKRIAETIQITEIVLWSRGFNKWKEADIASNQKNGYAKDNAILLADSDEADSTTTRLDDYRVRNVARNGLGKLFRKVFKQPAKEWFSLKNNKLRDEWRSIVKYLGSSGFISASDIRQERSKALAEVMPKTDGPIKKKDFFNRDLNKTYVFTPKEMGLCGGSPDGPLWASGQIMVNGMNLGDRINPGKVICDSISHFVYVPDNLMNVSDPHKKTADKKKIGEASVLMGVARIRNNRSDGSDLMTGGEHANVTFHEGLHPWFYEKHFDSDPVRASDHGGTSADHAWIRWMGDLAQVHYLDKDADPQEIAQFKADYGKRTDYSLVQAYYLAKYASPQEIAHFKTVHGNEKYLKLMGDLRKLYNHSLTKM